jgi:glycine/D-amino acid oxidase-like deaminating enzyme
LRAFGNTEILDARETASGVKLTCSSDEIVARAAVFCTGYFRQPWFPRMSTTLQTTYAACSQPLPPATVWSDRCLIWETARPYFYARQTSDGRAMIGGEDTPFADDHEHEGLRAAKGQRLKERFEQLFSGITFVPEYLWAGTFAGTKDGLPFIGRPPNQEKIYSALGYGGNGITFSMIAARLITDLILQRPNDDAAVFRFDR